MTIMRAHSCALLGSSIRCYAGNAESSVTASVTAVVSDI